MKDLEWCDKMGSRRRVAWLLLIKDDMIFTFSGQHIRGVCSVLSRKFEKNGQWSNTTYKLAIADDVRAIPGHDGWSDGSFVEGLTSALQLQGKGQPTNWQELADMLGVSIQSAQRFLREWRPKAAENLDNTEASLAALDAPIETPAEATPEVEAESLTRVAAELQLKVEALEKERDELLALIQKMRGEMPPAEPEEDPAEARRKWLQSLSS